MKTERVEWEVFRVYENSGEQSFGVLPTIEDARGLKDFWNRIADNKNFQIKQRTITEEVVE